MGEYKTPKSIPKSLDVIITILILILPLIFLYYSVITDISSQPIKQHTESFEFTNQDSEIKVVELDELFKNTEIYLYAERNTTTGSNIDILILEKNFYEEFVNNDFGFVFQVTSEIKLNDDTTSNWDNTSAPVQTTYFLLVFPTSSGAPTKVNILYWFVYPNPFERNLLGVFTLVGGTYLILFIGKRLIKQYPTRRFRKERIKQRQFEEDQYYKEKNLKRY